MHIATLCLLRQLNPKYAIALTLAGRDKKVKVNNVYAQLRSFLRPFNGVSSKYLQNYLNWYSYVGQLQNSKTTIKQWFLAMLATDQAYALFELFKHNAVIIRT